VVINVEKLLQMEQFLVEHLFIPQKVMVILEIILPLHQRRRRKLPQKIKTKIKIKQKTNPKTLLKLLIGLKSK
jgi:hypothetical protein